MKDLQNSKNCNIRSNLYVSEKKSARNFIFISIKQHTEKRPYSKLCETILFVFRIPPAHQCTIYSRLPHHFCSPEDNNISILKGHMYSTDRPGILSPPPLPLSSMLPWSPKNGRHRRRRRRCRCYRRRRRQLFAASP